MQDNLLKWFNTFDPMIRDDRMRYTGFCILYKLFAHLNNIDPNEATVDFNTAKIAIGVISTMNDSEIEEILNYIYSEDVPFVAELFDPEDWDLETIKQIKEGWESTYPNGGYVLAVGDKRFIMEEEVLNKINSEQLNELKEVNLLNPISVKFDENDNLVVE